MQWISVESSYPSEGKEVLVTDGERQWVAHGINVSGSKWIWLACHPDYNRSTANKYGCPFGVFSIPTHWMPLPEAPAVWADD